MHLFDEIKIKGARRKRPWTKLQLPTIRSSTVYYAGKPKPLTLLQRLVNTLQYVTDSLEFFTTSKARTRRKARTAQARHTPHTSRG